MQYAARTYRVKCFYTFVYLATLDRLLGDGTDRIHTVPSAARPICSIWRLEN